MSLIDQFFRWRQKSDENMFLELLLDKRREDDYIDLRLASTAPQYNHPPFSCSEVSFFKIDNSIEKTPL